MLIHLATRSPRRRELLSQIGVPHNQLEVQVDEIPIANEAPSEYVIRLALAKAQAGRAIINDLPVLGADTAVVIDNQIMGKPKSSEQAFTMMRRLSGRTHKVLTGVALITDKPESRLSVSRVTFRSVTPAEIQAYWRSGEPVDKAGGYAIQGLGAIFISRLEGSYSGVMGLPLFETAELLSNAGIKIPASSVKY